MARRVINLVIDGDDRSQGAFASATRNTNRLSGAAQGLFSQFRTGFAAIGGFAAAVGFNALLRQVRETAQEMDALVRTARVLNLEASELQAIQVVAYRDLNVEVEALNDSVLNIQERLGEARREVGSFSESFDILGLTVDRNTTVLDVFDAAVERLREGVDSGVILQVLREIGQDTAGEFLPLLESLAAGTTSFQDFTEAARESGIVLDELAIRNLANLEANIRQVETVWDSLTNKFTAFLAGRANRFLLEGGFIDDNAVNRLRAFESELEEVQNRIDRATRLAESTGLSFLGPSADDQARALALRYNIDLLNESLETTKTTAEDSGASITQLLQPLNAIDESLRRWREALGGLEGDQLRFAQTTIANLERTRAGLLGVMGATTTARTEIEKLSDALATPEERAENLFVMRVNTINEAAELSLEQRAELLRRAALELHNARQLIYGGDVDLEVPEASAFERLVQSQLTGAERAGLAYAEALRAIDEEVQRLGRETPATLMARRRANQTFIDSLDQNLDDDEQSVFRRAAGTAITSFAGNLEQAILNNEWDNVGSAFVQAVTATLVRSLLEEGTNLLLNFFGFGGPRQFGGQTQRGRPYLVGERGPELWVPSQDGSIVPNNMLGGSSFAVNISIDRPQVRSDEDLVELQRQTVALAKTEIFDELGRQGYRGAVAA